MPGAGGFEIRKLEAVVRRGLWRLREAGDFELRKLEAVVVRRGLGGVAGGWSVLGILLLAVFHLLPRSRRLLMHTHVILPTSVRLNLQFAQQSFDTGKN